MAFKKMGKFLGIKRSVTKYAYFIAKQTQLNFEMIRTANQDKLVEESTKNKVLIVGHAYSVGDKFIGSQIIDTLKKSV